MENVDYNHLLREYRRIWNNRLLDTHAEECEQVLMEAINRELQDENSHPRIRKNRYEKYYFAITRLSSSALSDKDKIQLILLHSDAMEKLKNE